MKTYAESQDKAPFNWNEFLNKEIYTLKELQEAKGLSDSWVTCAVGNQCSIIPRNELGYPNDWTLIDNGLRFATYIHKMCGYYPTNGFTHARKNAIEVLEVIERRSAELIQKLFN